jgi:hypothetical protein
MDEQVTHRFQLMKADSTGVVARGEGSAKTRQDRLAMGRAAITRREDTARYASKHSHMR